MNSAWPEPWNSIRHLIKRGCRSVWTYLELGQDVCGEACTTRRALLGQLIKAMGLPSGSIGFWPMSVPCKGRLVCDPELFRQGLARFDTAGLVIFGKSGFTHIFPDLEQEYGRFVHNGLMYLLLPALDELQPVGSRAYTDAVTALRDFLRFTCADVSD